MFNRQRDKKKKGSPRATTKLFSLLNLAEQSIPLELFSLQRNSLESLQQIDKQWVAALDSCEPNHQPNIKKIRSQLRELQIQLARLRP